jgi:hypothetical protein
MHWNDMSDAQKAISRRQCRGLGADTIAHALAAQFYGEGGQRVPYVDRVDIPDWWRGMVVMELLCILFDVKERA